MTTAQRLDLLHRVAGEHPRCASDEAVIAADVAHSENDRANVHIGELASSSRASVSTDEQQNTGIGDLIELILKRPDRLERIIREPSLQALLLPKFLTIALVGFMFFGIALSLVFTSAGEWPRLVPIRDLVAGEANALAAFDPLDSRGMRLGRWLDGAAESLIAAYAIGLIAATGVCLPSLYFYGLLAGVRMTMLDVVIQALKAKATGAVALVGILPIYAAFGLAVAIFGLSDAVRSAVFWVGLMLPFLAGLFGTYSLYRGLAGFADTLAGERRCQRACFLRRLVFSWATCYTAVTPVMIHSLWVVFARL